tara:strand:- start:499 stop:792 length:294 start_codon:yes stop_codon:yes gene_type:complete
MYSVEWLCGVKRSNQNFKSIDLNGNFIFENDPNFVAIQLWDRFNRTLVVNSFEECEHYVLGGWSYTQNLNIEQFSQLVIIFLLSSILIFRRKYFYKN